MTPDEGADLIINRLGKDIVRLHRYAIADPWAGRSIVDPRHRMQCPSLVVPGVGVLLLFTFDYGTHASGWWRNSDYDMCWHASFVFFDRESMEPMDPPDLALRSWARAVFTRDLDKAWTEPPASKLDIYRNASMSPYTTHLRVFVERATGKAIKPEGEVYTLKPWTDGGMPSPEKVFRS